jgi:hypothetical protein
MIKKIIYWRSDLSKNEKGEQFANVHIIGHNRSDFFNLQKMADEICRTFHAQYKDIFAGKIFSFHPFKGYAIVTFNAHIPSGEYLGWEQFDEKEIDYDW